MTPPPRGLPVTTKVCSVEGCDRGGKIRRGMCGTHYEQLRKQGRLEPLPTPATPAERFTASLIRTPNGCLEWTRHRTPQGYGQMGKGVLAHRFAWELAYGPIPDGLCVLHHCDNPPCCETSPSEAYPDGHLFLGTKADNNADMLAKKRGRQGEAQRAITHCPQGHAYDEANTHVTPKGYRRCRACARDRWHTRTKGTS